jgi:hypothetical protein
MYCWKNNIIWCFCLRLFSLAGQIMLPSGYVKIAIENGPVEIVDLPIEIVIFHSFLYIYQRV